MTDQSPQLFHSFNARTLSSTEVAKSFVVSDHFRQLVHPVHTLIVGPRGSGKTTLLKMLTSEALENWRAPEAEAFRQQVDFAGVFVATDRLWASQVKVIDDQREAGEIAVRSLLSAYLMRSIVAVMIHRSRPVGSQSEIVHNRVTLSEKHETEIVFQISKMMNIDLRLNSLLALKHGCLDRLRHFAAHSHSINGFRESNERAEETSAYLHSALLAIEMFNDYVGESGRKWILLFDELELAPSFVVRELLQAMRSIDGQLLFKLSISPHTHVLTEVNVPDGPVRGQDFEQLDLWYAHKDAGIPFAESLVRSLLVRHGLEPGTSAVDVFGWSDFAATESEMRSNDTAYKPGSRRLKAFTRLAEKDKTFMNFLAREGISVSDIPAISGARRAEVVRKVMPLVLLRDEVLSEGGEKSRKRSRKRPPAKFFGAQSLLAMTEGNPRWIIGLVGRMLDGMKTGQTTVTQEKQAREVERAMNRFRALLRTIPCESSATSASRRGVLSIIDEIGIQFHRGAVTEPFEPEPVGSFRVDSHEDSATVEALGQALNAGAIVFIPDHPGDTLLRSIRGKRFRLCYLFAPYYRIPIRLGRWISLSSILKRRTQSTDPLFGSATEEGE